MSETRNSGEFSYWKDLGSAPILSPVEKLNLAQLLQLKLLIQYFRLTFLDITRIY